MAELEVSESQLEINNRIMTKGEGVKTLSVLSPSLAFGVIS